MKKIARGLRHSLTVINHPIAGFYSIRFEGAGNVWACLLLLVLLVMAFVFQRQYSGFIFNTNNIREFNILKEISGVFMPVMLWCIANWSITALMDGEGRFRDIFMATCYATVPYTAAVFLSVAGSLFLSMEERTFLQIILGIGILLTAALLFSGMMTVHQFTVTKTLISIVFTLLGMAFIVFLALLFASTFDELLIYIGGIVTELQLRM